MNNAAIFHGTDDTPDLYWHPYLRAALGDAGYEVWAPQLPDAAIPDLDKWLSFATGHAYDTDTVLVGHSAGCPLILALLETLERPVRQTILVAGFGAGETDTEPIVKERYDWERIARNAGALFLIHSDNDPWGCDDIAGRKLFDRLGGTLIVRHGEGHMGSTKYDQPYREFPLLLQLIGIPT